MGIVEFLVLVGNKKLAQKSDTFINAHLLRVAFSVYALLNQEETKDASVCKRVVSKWLYQAKTEISIMFFTNFATIA